MLTSAALQLIAITSMLIDHLGGFLFHDHLTMRAIGRLAMPLFCFMLTEGFLHTEGKRVRYFGRLITFAFISQLAYDLVIFVGSGGAITDLPMFLATGLLSSSIRLNVLFTLAIGFVAMAAIEYSAWIGFCSVPILLIISELIHADYGAFGILMIIGFYLVSKIFHKEGQQIWRWLGYIITLFVVTTAQVMIDSNPIQLFAFLAIIPIILYNGKLGKRLPKWFGYIFYPAHLLLIAVIAFIVTAAQVMYDS